MFQKANAYAHAPKDEEARAALSSLLDFLSSTFNISAKCLMLYDLDAAKTHLKGLLGLSLDIGVSSYKCFGQTNASASSLNLQSSL